MSDLRLSTNFADHPKTIKLVRLLGDDVIRQLLRLWGAAAIDCPDGKLRGMDIEDIEIMAGWDGEDGLFVRTLVDHGWLDLKRKTYYLHNWAERQPWISNARARSEAAKRKAEIRWSKRLRVEEPVIVHENAMLPLQSSNAPSPNPTPTPTPTLAPPPPTPTPTRVPTAMTPWTVTSMTFQIYDAELEAYVSASEGGIAVIHPGGKYAARAYCTLSYIVGMNPDEEIYLEIDLNNDLIALQLVKLLMLL